MGILCSRCLEDIKNGKRERSANESIINNPDLCLWHLRITQKNRKSNFEKFQISIFNKAVDEYVKIKVKQGYVFGHGADI